MVLVGVLGYLLFCDWFDCFGFVGWYLVCCAVGLPLLWFNVAVVVVL